MRAALEGGEVDPLVDGAGLEPGFMGMVLLVRASLLLRRSQS